MNKAIDQQFKQRDYLLNKYGYLNYKNYLLSKEWLLVKKWVKTRKLIKWHRCWICKSKNKLNVHHKSYSIIGTGIKKLSPRYIVVLCENCHKQIHDFTKNNQTSLRNAVKKVKIMALSDKKIR